MQDNANSLLPAPGRIPWNKGKLIGAKPPLRQKHVWAIRTKLQIDQRTRDLALFNLAIDSKLRGCDVVALKVEDVAPNGYSADRATVRQKKTGRPVRFELTEQTRQAVDGYIRATGKKPHACSAPIPSGGQRRHRSTAAPATCEPYSYCSATPRLRAPSDISALRWMTLFPSPNRLTSEIGPGGASRSARASLPRLCKPSLLRGEA